MAHGGQELAFCHIGRLGSPAGVPEDFFAALALYGIPYRTCRCVKYVNFAFCPFSLVEAVIKTYKSPEFSLYENWNNEYGDNVLGKEKGLFKMGEIFCQTFYCFAFSQKVIPPGKGGVDGYMLKGGVVYQRSNTLVYPLITGAQGRLIVARFQGIVKDINPHYPILPPYPCRESISTGCCCSTGGAPSHKRRSYLSGAH